ncbi:hypothetical protein C2E23DRAFT_13492 [Lenzites betulinus]|nr:hypothetical protein C2E23DRAFT_13492 [Lenzites betulinus]
MSDRRRKRMRHPKSRVETLTSIPFATTPAFPLFCATSPRRPTRDSDAKLRLQHPHETSGGLTSVHGANWLLLSESAGTSDPRPYVLDPRVSPHASDLVRLDNESALMCISGSRAFRGTVEVSLIESRSTLHTLCRTEPSHIIFCLEMHAKDSCFWICYVAICPRCSTLPKRVREYAWSHIFHGSMTLKHPSYAAGPVTVLSKPMRWYAKETCFLLEARKRGLR